MLNNVGFKIMKQYKRCIGSKIISVFIDEMLFERERKIFDLLFASYLFSNEESSGSNEENYYVYGKNYSEDRKRTPFFICDTDSDRWIFKLMKNLEIFYSKVLKCTVIHGSCVSINDKNILFMGARRSGKTTLTHYLTIEKNGIYLDDDCVYLVDGMYVGFCMPLPMRDAVDLSYNKFFITKTTDTDGIIRFLYSPQHSIHNVHKIDMVVFPQYGSNRVNCIKKMSSSEAFNRIIKNVRSYSEMKTMFTDIKKLATTANCYDLQYSNSDFAYDLLYDEVFRNESIF